MSEHSASKPSRRAVATAFAAMITALAVIFTGVLGTTAQADPKPGSKPTLDSDVGKVISRVKGTSDKGHRVGGTFTPTEFAENASGLTVTGTLDLVVKGKGRPQRETVENVTFQVVDGGVKGIAGGGGAAGMAMAAGSGCNILNLVLGPLDLNVLGLEIHLDQVVLDIIAQPGAGNLLGNLLCQVAGLLDGTSLGGILGDALTQIVGILNNLLEQLGL